MSERVVSTPAFFTWLKKECGLNLPEHCTGATIQLTDSIVRIECEVIASMTVDAQGNLPKVTKRYKLVEIDDDDQH